MKAKFFLITIMSLLGLSMNAQTNNFLVSDDGKLVWQKIYNTELSYDALLSSIVNNGQFADIVDNDGKITCRLLSAPVDYKSMGYSRGTVPLYISTTEVTCFATIQVKEGKYRATVEQIVLTTVEEGLSHKGDTDPLDTWAVRKGMLTRGFSTTPSIVYDKFFSDIFSFKTKAYLNNEW